jgi:RNA-directed DNA polymerase
MDIKGFFDNIDHDLMMRAVRKHTDCKWILLYIERWLKAPVRCEDGTLQQRDTGTPQGGVVSPLLANIFLHHAFDAWMAKEYSYIPFERYADDIVAHCNTKNQAHFMLGKIVERLKACKLEVHPDKTEIVYCKDDNRTGKYSRESFDFLGFTFQPRHAKNRFGTFFVAFLPGVSRKAAKAMRAEIRKWRLHRKSRYSLEYLSLVLKAKIQGWINYYGKYYKSALDSVFQWLNRRLVRWVRLKYKRYRLQRRATHWLRRIARKEPELFPHWKFGVYP